MPERTGSFIGLNTFAYAKLTKDDKTGVQYSEVIEVPGIISAKVDPKTSSEVQFFDDGPGATQTVIGQVDLELELNQIPHAVLRDWLGHKIVKGVLVGNTGDKAPYVAVGFKTPTVEGGNQYIWLYKGKFEIPGSEHSTQTDKAGMKTRKIKGTFVRRNFDNQYRVIGDDNEPEFTYQKTWFNKVFEVDATVTTTKDNPNPTV